jgi:hypothetical protein
MEWKLAAVFVLNHFHHALARLLRVERRSRAVSENGGGHGGGGASRCHSHHRHRTPERREIRARIPEFL